MSHFTYIKTRFQNLFYLKKTLDQLNITSEEQIITNAETKAITINLVIPQFNSSDITFSYNGQEYELIVDLDYWKQPYSVSSFINQVAQQYACEVITEESQKLGLQKSESKTILDGSNILILEGWK